MLAYQTDLSALYNTQITGEIVQDMELHKLRQHLLVCWYTARKLVYPVPLDLTLGSRYVLVVFPGVHPVLQCVQGSYVLLFFSQDFVFACPGLPGSAVVGLTGTGS